MVEEYASTFLNHILPQESARYCDRITWGNDFIKDELICVEGTLLSTATLAMNEAVFWLGPEALFGVMKA